MASVGARLNIYNIKFPRDVSSYKSRLFEIAGKLSLLILSFVLFGRPDFIVIGGERPASVMFIYTLPQIIIPRMTESNAKFSVSISVKVSITVAKYFINKYF